LQTPTNSSSPATITGDEARTIERSPEISIAAQYLARRNAIVINRAIVGDFNCGTMPRSLRDAIVINLAIAGDFNWDTVLRSL
jgi:hypothetical protein